MSDTKRIRFKGLRRKHGRAGVRNDLWIVPAAGCLNGALESLVSSYRKQYWIDSVRLLRHDSGCRRFGGSENIWQIEKMLVSLSMNPNAAGVLVVDIECGDFQASSIMESADAIGRGGSIRRVSYSENSESDILTELDRLGNSAPRTREFFELSELCVGYAGRSKNCGMRSRSEKHLDSFSDWLIGNGGTLLIAGARNKSWKIGALEYGERIKITGGVRPVFTPDGIIPASTSLAAAGAQIAICDFDAPLPFGGIVPTIRIRSDLTSPSVPDDWIDIDLSGDPGPYNLAAAALAVAGGEKTASERKGICDIAIGSGGSWSFTA